MILIHEKESLPECFGQRPCSSSCLSLHLLTLSKLSTKKVDSTRSCKLFIWNKMPATAYRVNINPTWLLWMYLPGTSDGTESHINDTSGGHCNDTKRGIFMKIEVYVCKKNNLNDTGIFISLPRSCLCPTPFHSV